MGQLTIYLPDAVEKRYRRNAKRARKTISAYIASLDKTYPDEPRDKNGYTQGFYDAFGSCPDFEAPPRDRTPLEIPNLELVPRRHRRVQRVSQRRRSGKRRVAR